MTITEWTLSKKDVHTVYVGSTQQTWIGGGGPERNEEKFRGNKTDVCIEYPGIYFSVEEIAEL